MVFGLENYVPNPYIRSLLILLIVFSVLRILMVFVEKIFLRLTSKTKTDIDDKFIAKASKPITVWVLLIGIRFAVEEIPLTESVSRVFENIITSLIIINLAFIVYYFIDIVLFVALKKSMGKSSSARESLMSLLHSIIKVLLFALTLLYILSLWGIEIGPFLAALGIAGLAVALALQPALANIFSGVSLILDKTLKVGDLIYLDTDTKGKVLHVGLRSTKILTFDNELIIVPNSKVADSKIQNVAEPEPKTRVVIPFGVAYGSNVSKVKKIVITELNKIENFIANPEPIVRFTEMANSSLNFKAYFYVDSFENKWKAIDEANTLIYNALNKNKISIPFPQLDINIKEKK